jgi:hypothetical protein
MMARDVKRLQTVTVVFRKEARVRGVLIVSTTARVTALEPSPRARTNQRAGPKRWPGLAASAWISVTLMLLCPVAGQAQDSLVATVQTAAQHGYTTEAIDLSSPTYRAGVLVPLSTAPLGSLSLSTYNWHPHSQLKQFIAALSTDKARLVTLGDSTTRGHNAAVSGWTQLSYSVELAQILTQDGIAAQSDNFLGNGVNNTKDSDFRITFIGGAAWDSDAVDAGGSAVQTFNDGDGLTFTLNTPGSYDRLTVSYVDVGTGAASVAVDGATVGSLQFTGTENTLTQTITLPARSTHSVATVLQTGPLPVVIQGVSFSDTRHLAVQVMNAGIGGWTSVQADTSDCMGSEVLGSACGFGQTAGTVALHPKLVIVDLGINDIRNNVPEATIAASIAQIVATLKAAGSDVVIMVPGPFVAPNYMTGITALESDMRALADQDDVGMIDLSATYRYNYAKLRREGLMGNDELHPDATLYADIAQGIARLLVPAILN